MPKITNNTLILLKAIAESLPPEEYTVNQKVIKQGRELLQSMNLLGKPIDPDANYTLKRTAYAQANHLRRLKKAYTKNGLAGIMAYSKKYLKPNEIKNFENFLQSKKQILTA